MFYNPPLIFANDVLLSEVQVWLNRYILKLLLIFQDGMMELPPAESCALDDGEEEEVQFTQNAPRGILSKLKHNKVAVSGSKLITLNLKVIALIMMQWNKWKLHWIYIMKMVTTRLLTGFLSFFSAQRRPWIACRFFENII